MNRVLGLIFGASLFLAGCGTPPSASNETTPPPATPPAGNETPETTAKTVPPVTSPAATEVPEALKHDAYEYYGLNRTEAVPMEIRSTTGEVLTGTQTYTLTGVEGGEAKYSVTRTGGLERLGNETLVISSKGLRVESTTLGQIENEDLSMPAQLTDGTTWKVNHRIKTQVGQTVEEQATYRVMGNQKVTTKAGTFDALWIKSNGTATVDGQKGRMNTESWYVKGRGPVKIVIESIPTKGNPSTLIIEETK